MEPATTAAGPAPADRRRGRRVFFSWFLALLGLGAAMLALLLLGTGSVAWWSPVMLALFALSVVGVVCLVFALVSLFLARSRVPPEEPPG
jgi:hypothetical protein